jgi:hypothetical protein
LRSSSLNHASMSTFDGPTSDKVQSR